MKVVQLCLTLCDPMDCIVQNSPGQNTGVGSLSILQGIPNAGIEPGSPTFQGDSLPAEPPGKPQNTGVGSLSLLQGNLLTQESNWGLLGCRLILYQLSYQGSLVINIYKRKFHLLYNGIIIIWDCYEE